ncbi:trypsin-like serine peptidase [Streptomyces halobius]|uniref:Serine protease n=1 Tax=Streptomyces halobius TaxID=2879846 RepID=A0ABY4M4F6_9ACTN|nr:serine protease [Streptomyces halobius]UQA91709.1 serine protease [Streptomyces halobius]
METSEHHPVPAEGADDAGGPAGDREPDEPPCQDGPACTGHRRAGVPLRVTLALTLLTVVTGGAALALRSGPGDPSLAPGDAARGTYSADRAAGDAAAASVLAGGYTERPGPPGTTLHSGASASPPASRPPVAAPAAPAPPIGALFSPAPDAGPDDAPTHHCTASVVHSPAGDLVATAAHCVHDGGFRTRLVFAPGLHDGIAPYGLWVPTRIDVDPRWISDQDPDHDVAFLRVRRAGREDRRIEALTGAERIRFHAPAGRPAQLTGYPLDRDTPVSCRHTADAEGPSQFRFPCAGFPDGTSGGPLLTDLDPATGTGSLIGVIGGLDGGGDDNTSYSSRFDEDIAALYRRATTAQLWRGRAPRLP